MVIRYTAVQKKTAVTAYLKSKQLLLFAFASLEWDWQGDKNWPKKSETDIKTLRQVMSSPLLPRISFDGWPYLGSQSFCDRADFINGHFLESGRCHQQQKLVWTKLS